MAAARHRAYGAGVPPEVVPLKRRFDSYSPGRRFRCRGRSGYDVDFSVTFCFDGTRFLPRFLCPHSVPFFRQQEIPDVAVLDPVAAHVKFI